MTPGTLSVTVRGGRLRHPPDERPPPVPPFYSDDSVTVHHGDCLDVLRALPDASIDAVVTDPPYELGFMGKGWDASGIAYRVDLWAECLRVLKPGGHLLAFGGTRTWHRLTCAIEDAGFDIRDTIFWLYGSGFPKSLNVAKDARFCQCQAVPYSHVEKVGPADLSGVRGELSPLTDEAPGAATARMFPSVSREAGRGSAGGIGEQGSAGVDVRDPGVVPAEDEWPTEPRMEGRSDLQAGEGQLRRTEVRAVPAGPAGDGTVGRVRDGASAGDGSLDRSPAAAVRGGQSHQPRPEGQSQGEPGAVPVERGSQAGRGWPVCGGCGKPSVPSGLGTALKPASEPVVVARKPLGGTVAATVLAHGTGALNIDATRVASVPSDDIHAKNPHTVGGFGHAGATVYTTSGRAAPTYDPSRGRWPANVILTHGDCGDECAPGCPVAELDAQSGNRPTQKTRSTPDQHYGEDHVFAFGNQRHGPTYFGEQGGASRFFPVFRYQAKAPTRERPKVDGVAHPTVKPLALMAWLIRLVTPPGGVVLDPFAGSGTTVEAALAEGFRCITIEREAEYLPLILARIERQAAVPVPRDSPEQMSLLDDDPAA